MKLPSPVSPGKHSSKACYVKLDQSKRAKSYSNPSGTFILHPVIKRERERGREKIEERKRKKETQRERGKHARDITITVDSGQALVEGSYCR